MLRWYQSVLKRRPLLTQSLTTAILFGTGDIAAQQLVESTGPSNHAYSRTARMALYGGTIFGPAATTWYRFLQARVNLSSKATTVAARVGLDQLVFTPINLTCFLSSMAVMEGWKSSTGVGGGGVNGSSVSAGERVREKMGSTFGQAFGKNLLIWPWVQIANFSVVPLEHRVLLVNVVALGWNCYLSYLNSGGGKTKTEATKEKVVETVKKA
ncbi:hypothetical protein BT63DRAFT_429652 [Microthyrium microscopicum]|uniref:Uncharacterized protein n=1 Tax=Microthyrium microscopicum TaxID=703497 RepID=A0A6A6TVK5_9PEZI|nr:hypothetical protein BT63DRAFT_429652 [Microthyrium microscopicum]